MRIQKGREAERRATVRESWIAGTAIVNLGLPGCARETPHRSTGTVRYFSTCTAALASTVTGYCPLTQKDLGLVGVDPCRGSLHDSCQQTKSRGGHVGPWNLYRFLVASLVGSGRTSATSAFPKYRRNSPRTALRGPFRGHVVWRLAEFGYDACCSSGFNDNTGGPVVAERAVCACGLCVLAVTTHAHCLPVVPRYVRSTEYPGGIVWLRK
jgi:hypothetical protein